IVGFKPTAARVPQDGCLPLSTSLDSIGPLAPSVACCIAIDRVLAWQDIGEALPAPTPAGAITLAVPRAILTDGLERPVAAAFARALSRLSAAGCRLVDVALPPVAHAGLSGGIALFEAFAWHRDLLAMRRAFYDPFVAKQIAEGAAIDTAAY